MLNELAVIVALLLAAVPAAAQQVGIGISFPNVSIGINLPIYPELMPVPGYPVYYAPRLDSNYFFYDGLYWVYLDDIWYSSSWYNGPWFEVHPEFVPLYILRVPVRYYRRPPMYFQGWAGNGPPRWDEHWGHDWAERHRGWDRWNRDRVPAAAPLPVYQRQYSGNRYPAAPQQQTLTKQNYRYQPRDPAVRQLPPAQHQLMSPNGLPDGDREQERHQRQADESAMRQHGNRPPGVVPQAVPPPIQDRGESRRFGGPPAQIQAPPQQLPRHEAPRPQGWEPRAGPRPDEATQQRRQEFEQMRGPAPRQEQNRGQGQGPGRGERERDGGDKHGDDRGQDRHR